MERTVISRASQREAREEFGTKGFGSLERAGSRVAGAAHDIAIGHADNQS
jgi:hypothetical protein